MTNCTNPDHPVAILAASAIYCIPAAKVPVDMLTGDFKREDIFDLGSKFLSRLQCSAGGIFKFCPECGGRIELNANAKKG